MGQQFVAPAFITVVVGGATNVIAGAVGSSLLAVAGQDAGRLLLGAFLGTVALLLAALVIIRLMPDGISACSSAGSTGATGRLNRCGSSRLLTGPEDIGQSRWFWAGFVAGLAFLFFIQPLSEFDATNIAYYLSTCRWRSGSALLWGYCGVLSFGQVAYFGIAGYVYGIVAGNMIGNAWGRWSDRSAASPSARWWRRSSAISCSTPGCRTGSCRSSPSFFTLLLETFLGQTAGYQWRIGTVQLGGYNGMTGIPAFQLGQLVVHRLPLLLLRTPHRCRGLFGLGCGCW